MNKMPEIMKISLKKIKPFFALLSSGIFLVLVFQMAYTSFSRSGTLVQQNSQNELSASVANAFDGLSLDAEAAYVYDINKNQVLFALHPDEKLPLASITKIMTTLVARENASESALITITKDDLSTEGDTGFLVGEHWRMGDLLNAMLIISSNDGAHTIARFIGSGGQPVAPADEAAARTHFVQMMNAQAQSLGLTEMAFFNESGLDIVSTSTASSTINHDRPLLTPGSYGSAHDVALLLTDLWKKYPANLEITTLPAARIVSQDNIAHVLPNTDEDVGKIPGLIASKTGYTTLAGGNLAVIFDRGINDPVVAVVLGSSYKGRFNDMTKLVDAAIKDSAIPNKI